MRVIEALHTIQGHLRLFLLSGSAIEDRKLVVGSGVIRVELDRCFELARRRAKVITFEIEFAEFVMGWGKTRSGGLLEVFDRFRVLAFSNV